MTDRFYTCTISKTSCSVILSETHSLHHTKRLHLGRLHAPQPHPPATRGSQVLTQAMLALLSALHACGCRLG